MCTLKQKRPIKSQAAKTPTSTPMITYTHGSKDDGKVVLVTVKDILCCLKPDQTSLSTDLGGDLQQQTRTHKKRKTLSQANEKEDDKQVLRVSGAWLNICSHRHSEQIYHLRFITKIFATNNTKTRYIQHPISKEGFQDGAHLHRNGLETLV